MPTLLKNYYLLIINNEFICSRFENSHLKNVNAHNIYK